MNLYDQYQKALKENSNLIEHGLRFVVREVQEIRSQEEQRFFDNAVIMERWKKLPAWRQAVIILRAMRTRDETELR